MALSESRLLSRPHWVHFAGFTSDTARLQNAGWNLSAHQDVRGSVIQLVMRHEAAGCYMLADAQHFDYFSFGRYGDAELNFVVRKLSKDIITQIANVDFSKFAPIDAEPQFVEMKRQSIKDFNIFASPLVRTQEIIVDRIKRAIVNCADAGTWSGVVGLDFSEGQLVTVFLQDALLPENEAWEFMRRHKWRVRMARFKGAPSECVIVPLVLGDGQEMPEPGQDLAERLGVTKYSKPLPPEMSGVAAGSFPSFIPKTDETNFQAVPAWRELMESSEWVARVKCDGSSTTVWNDADGNLHVASRNLELKEFSDTGWVVHLRALLPR